jgi:sodium transport system permease protein
VIGWRTAGIVAAKELRETLRDRRTLFMMLLLPTLLYPALFLLTEQMALFGQRALAREPATVLAAGVGTELRAHLDADTTIRLVEVDAAPAAAVRERRAEVALVGGDAASVAPEGPGTTTRVRVLYDASNDRSRRAREVVHHRLDAWGDTLLSRRLREAGLPEGFARPLAVADTSVATAEEAGGYALGRFLPVLLILMTLLGTFYPAIDLAAGEKERGTLETLLTAAVPPRDIVAGKFIAVSLIGMAAAAANLGSMLLTFQTGLFRFAAAAGVRFTLAPSSALLVLAALVPLAVLFAALFLGIAVRSQSFKEAQNALTPVQLASTLPVLVVMLPGIEFNLAIAVVPVLGIAMLFREVMAGTAALLPSLVAFGATVAYALAALAFAARAFGREDVLFGGGAAEAPSRSAADRLRAWRTGPRRLPGPAEGLLFIAAVGLLFFHLGGRWQAAHGEAGLLASEWLLLGLAAVAFAALGPYDVRRTLALRPVGGRTLLAALLIALGGVPLGFAIGWVQLQFFPGAADALAGLEQLVTATDARRAMWLFFLVALTPAVCEELVFRGVLLQSFAGRVAAWRAIAATALVFGAFHLSFETAIRFLPTAFIGVLLGFVAWHARSVAASMLMHFVNNAVAVVLLWQPAVRALVLRDDQPVWVVVAVAPLVLAAGVWLLPKRATEPEDPNPGDPPWSPPSS